MGTGTLVCRAFRRWRCGHNQRSREPMAASTKTFFRGCWLRTRWGHRNRFVPKAVCLLAVFALSCGSSTGIRSASSGARLVPLVHGDLTASALAINGADVFYNSTLGGRDELRTVPKSGGVSRVVATSPGTPYAILADESFVYWTAGANPATLNRIPLAGGPVETLFHAPLIVKGFAIDREHAYVQESSLDAGTGTVWSVPLGGGPPVALARGLSLSGGLVVDTQYVYANDVDRVVRIPQAGGPVEAVFHCASVNCCFVALASDGQVLYARDQDGTARAHSNTPDGSPAVLLGPALSIGNDGLLDIFTASSVAYWNVRASVNGPDQTGQGVVRASADGTGFAYLTSSGQNVIGPRADGSDLFYFSDGTLFRQAQ